MSGLFKKRRNIFIQMIHDQAALTLEGLDILKEYMADQASPPRLGSLLKKKRPTKPAAS